MNMLRVLLILLMMNFIVSDVGAAVERAESDETGVQTGVRVMHTEDWAGHVWYMDVFVTHPETGATYLITKNFWMAESDPDFKWKKVGLSQKESFLQWLWDKKVISKAIEENLTRGPLDPEFPKKLLLSIHRNITWDQMKEAKLYPSLNISFENPIDDLVKHASSAKINIKEQCMKSKLVIVLPPVSSHD